jgi:predicted  nucleic acid-binding Zn-ribbon protein
MFGATKFDKSLNGIKVLTDGIITIQNGNINGVNYIDADNINALQNKVDNITIDVSDNINKIDDINNIKIPNLQSQINNNTNSINTINTNANNLQTQVTTNTNFINTIINTSIPNLDAQINYTNSSVNAINNISIPNLQSQINTNTTNITSLNTNVSNLQTQTNVNTNFINTIINSSIPNLDAKINTNTTNITSLNTNVSNLQTQTNTNSNNITSINNNIATNTNSINIINNSSIPNLQSQINSNTSNITNLNNQVLELDDLNTGLFTNNLNTTPITNVEAENNLLSPVFLTINTNKNNNRQFLLNIPVAIKLTFNSNLISATSDLRLTNLVFRVFKNGVLFNNYTGEPLNAGYGVINDMAKPGTGNGGAIGIQYNNNFMIFFQPDFNNNTTNDVYTFCAIPTFAWTTLQTGNTVLRLLINTNVSTTSTVQAPITYNNSTTSGYTPLTFSSELPVSKPNLYLGAGLINYFPLLNIIMPIGYIYISTNKINPRYAFGGFGTWEAINNRFLRGIDINSPSETVAASGVACQAGTNGIDFYNAVFFRRIS